METNALISCFEEFKIERNAAKEQGRLSITSLSQLFERIAQHLIYCGHFEVRSNGKLYRSIYLDTVEFYYHEEGDGKIKDYIVYHRNKDKTPPLEAFPVGSLNAHVSGMDITFEDQSEKPEYRASALIRRFSVKEIVPTKGLHPCPIEGEKRSTYLYEHLFMGLPINDGIHIKWVVDSNHTDSVPHRGYRVNVHKYDIGEKGLPVKREKEKDKDLKDYLDRKGWAFSRYPFEKPWAIDNDEEK